MGLFSRTKQTDPLDGRADELPQLAHVAAISLLEPLLEQSDYLAATIREKGTDHWDFFATIGIVTCGIYLLNDKVAEDRAARLIKRILQASPRRPSPSGAPPSNVELFWHQWDKMGERAVLDCMTFVKKRIDRLDEHNGAVYLQAAIGLWVLWNIYGDQPPRNDQAALLLGPMLFQNVVGYWGSVRS